MSNLASNLSGMNVNGWQVGRKFTKDGGCTGGSFSSGYEVQHSDGREAFMKAINLGYAFKMFGRPGVSRTDIISSITSDFRYERDLLQLCGTRSMDRVVVAIDSGEFFDPSDPYFIPYLVFELCKEGDIRRQTYMRDPGLAWRLKVFHGVCVGIMQLHNNEIAHQDLKPSNVLVFNRDRAKIADLGRSTVKSADDRFATDDHIGDASYTPIELQYQHYETDWDVRRKGADLYMLGGILAFLVSNVHIYGLILSKLPSSYHPVFWSGGFVAALPAIKTATNDAIAEISNSVPKELAIDIKQLLGWLCEPEPSKRGHPKTLIQKHGSRFSLERIVSHANTLAAKASIIK